MRLIHIPVMLLLALYLLGHFGSGLCQLFPALTSTVLAQGNSTGTHYAPAENLERLDVAALRIARRTIDVSMYAFTDRILAEAILDRARQGVRVRIYRDGEQFEQEQQRKGRGGSTTDVFRGQRNIEIRVKRPSARNNMHLKDYSVDGTLLRDGSANFSVAGEVIQDNEIHFGRDVTEIEAFERNFEAMWNRRENRVVQ